MALEHVERRAARIRERRLELGLTQEDLADRMIEIHRRRNPDAPPDRTRGQMVSDWERAVNAPTGRKLELLAEALETTVADLTAGPKSERTKPSGTPDLLSVGQSQPSDSDLGSRLDHMESRINELHSKIDEVLAALYALSAAVTSPDEEVVRLRDTFAAITPTEGAGRESERVTRRRATRTRAKGS